MEADPDAGIIQTLPLIINRNTLFARVQQFAARIYGPVIAAGLSLPGWAATAITGATTPSSARGLRASLRPARPARPAALRRAYPEPRLRRGGADPPRRLRRLHDADARRLLRGKPALADRSRRSATGAGARATCSIRACSARAGLHWASRQHFLTGIFGYLTSPLWLLQLLVGIVLVFQASYFRPEYFTERIRAVPDLAAVRRRALAGALRADHGHSARAEVLRPASSRSTSRETRRGSRRRDHAADLDPVRDPAVGAARADHDADPDRPCASHPVRLRHGLGPAAARRRLGALRRHRPPPPLACGAGRR